MKMRKLGVCALTAAASVAGAAVVAAPAGATGPGLFHYSVHTTVHEVQDMPNGPCGGPATVTLDATRNASVAATEAGVSDADLLALLMDDPNSVIRQVTQTTTGTAVLVTGGHTYSGTFTEWGEGHFMPNGMYVQSGIGSYRLVSELGTLLLFHGQGHDLDGSDGVEKMFTNHGALSGCLP